VRSVRRSAITNDLRKRAEALDKPFTPDDAESPLIRPRVRVHLLPPGEGFYVVVPTIGILCLNTPQASASQPTMNIVPPIGTTAPRIVRLVQTSA